MTGCLEKKVCGINCTDSMRWTCSLGIIFNDIPIAPDRHKAPVLQALLTCWDVRFAPAATVALRFSLMNSTSTAKCAYDNAFNKGHLIQYKTNLIKRYGAKRVADLEERYNDSRYKGKTTKNWNKKQYEVKIIEIQEKLAAL